jgi:hypothetical protein
MSDAKHDNYRATFILLKTEFDPHATVEAIERLGGRIRHGFLPHAVIAMLSSASVWQISQRSDIALATTEAIESSRVNTLDGPARSAAAAWNQFLHGDSNRFDPSGSLSWDTFGHLPPDPPASVRQQLRQRERETGITDQSPSEEE